MNNNLKKYERLEAYMDLLINVTNLQYKKHKDFYQAPWQINRVRHYGDISKLVSKNFKEKLIRLLRVVKKI